MELISFSDAKRAGLTRYCTGQPCNHGHIAERYVSTRACFVCIAAKSKQWKKKNPEKHAAQKVAWNRKNPDKVSKLRAAWSRANPESQARRARKWFLANRDKANAATRAWNCKNPGKRNARAAQQRADWIQRTPRWSDFDQIAVIYEEARRRRDSGEMVEVDHVIPLRGKRVSGLHVHANLQIIPALMNRVKSNHFLEI